MSTHAHTASTSVRASSSFKSGLLQRRGACGGSGHPVWINCKVCSAHLPDHLALQEYEILTGALPGTSKKP
jgi:hypothetical protein